MCKTMVYQRHSVKNPVEYLISNFLVLLICRSEVFGYTGVSKIY